MALGGRRHPLSVSLSQRPPLPLSRTRSLCVSLPSSRPGFRLSLSQPLTPFLSVPLSCCLSLWHVRAPLFILSRACSLSSVRRQAGPGELARPLSILLRSRAILGPLPSSVSHHPSLLSPAPTAPISLVGPGTASPLEARLCAAGPSQGWVLAQREQVAQRATQPVHNPHEHRAQLCVRPGLWAWPAASDLELSRARLALQKGIRDEGTAKGPRGPEDISDHSPPLLRTYR